MRRCWKLLPPLALVSCGAFSASNYASSRCSICDAKAPVLTEEPIAIDYTWPDSKDPSAAVTPTVSCEGTACEVTAPEMGRAEEREISASPEGPTSAGRTGRVMVVPKTGGALLIKTALKDAFGSQRWSYGPVTVIAPDRLELACRASDQQAGAVRNCAEAHVGDLMRVEISLFKGSKRLGTSVFGTLSVDDKQVRPGEWGCARSESTPEITSCASGTQVFSPGSHTLRVVRGPLSAELKMSFN